MWMQEKPTGMHRPVCMDVERYVRTYWTDLVCVKEMRQSDILMNTFTLHLGI